MIILTLLPVFTLRYPAQRSIDMKQLELKAIKKYKKREDQKKVAQAQREIEKEQRPDTMRQRRMQQEDEDTNLYDADWDDLDSSDIGEDEKKKMRANKTSKYDPGLHSNIGALREAIYLFAFLITF